MPNHDYQHHGYQQLLNDLKSLRLSAMADMLDSYTKQAVAGSWSYTDFLRSLVTEEIHVRDKRGIQNRIKSAKFPLIKRLEEFDFQFQPSMEKQRIDELATLRFIEHNENVLLLGPPGVGKTHAAIGLGLKACEAGYRVLFTTLHEMNSLLLASLADNSFAG